jgi:hypothetical protein
VSVEQVPQLVLGIDTSTVVNVGLASGDHVLATATVHDPRAHVESLIPLVRQCLSQGHRRLSDVEHLVVGMGPGPFTGLRVGIATAQVLSAALGIRLHGICSLDVVAAQYVADFAPADDFAVADIFPHQLCSVSGPRSLDPGVLASVGLRLPSVGTEPLYLRRADATEPTRRKSVLVRGSGGSRR